MSRRWSSLARRSLFVRCWLLPTWLLLGGGRLIALLVPFRRLSPWLGRRSEVPGVVVEVDAAAQRRAASIAEVLALAARLAPWDANCFAQALAGRVLLAVYGVPSVCHFGVRRAGTALQAHCWVMAGPVAVSGQAQAAGFTVVGSFVRQPLRPQAGEKCP